MRDYHLKMIDGFNEELAEISSLMDVFLRLDVVHYSILLDVYIKGDKLETVAADYNMSKTILVRRIISALSVLLDEFRSSDRGPD